MWGTSPCQPFERARVLPTRCRHGFHASPRHLSSSTDFRGLLFSLNAARTAAGQRWPCCGCASLKAGTLYSSSHAHARPTGPPCALDTPFQVRMEVMGCKTPLDTGKKRLWQPGRPAWLVRGQWKAQLAASTSAIQEPGRGSQACGSHSRRHGRLASPPLCRRPVHKQQSRRHMALFVAMWHAEAILWHWAPAAASSNSISQQELWAAPSRRNRVAARARFCA